MNREKTYLVTKTDAESVAYNKNVFSAVPDQVVQFFTFGNISDASGFKTVCLTESVRPLMCTILLFLQKSTQIISVQTSVIQSAAPDCICICGDSKVGSHFFNIIDLCVCQCRNSCMVRENAVI